VSRRGRVRPSLAAAASLLAAAARCATTPSPAARGVLVLHAKEGYGAKASPLPAGCRLVGAHPSVDQTERDLAISEFRRERERAASSGANVVLAREEMIVPRRDYDCPASSKITDCPPSEGAWFRVVYEDYACSPDAVDALRSPSPPR
jgi:hypothetical protein